MLTRKQIEDLHTSMKNDQQAKFIHYDMYEIATLFDMALAHLEAQEKPLLAKHQPCGCVVCTCDDEDRCHGCGAKHCGTHPVGQIPNPVYSPTPDKVTI